MKVQKHYKIREIKQSNSREITLPIEWLDHHDLKPGDSLTVLADDLLIIAPSNKPKLVARSKQMMNTVF